MAKLILKPHLNSNFARAIYFGLLWAIFRYCSDTLAVKYFGTTPKTMTLLASVMGLLMFSYLVYLILELQDRITKHHPQEGQRTAKDDPQNHP